MYVSLAFSDVEAGAADDAFSSTLHNLLIKEHTSQILASGGVALAKLVARCVCVCRLKHQILLACATRLHSDSTATVNTAQQRIKMFQASADAVALVPETATVFA